jgi:hypothetical protein
VTFLASTTGLLDPVILDDVGGLILPHPTVDRDLQLELNLDELLRSQSIADAMTNGYLTVKDSQGNVITDPAELSNVEVMVGATAFLDGESGTVPKPLAGEQGKFLQGDGEWQTPGQDHFGTSIFSGGELTINGGDPAKFDVAAGNGLVVNNHSDPNNPVVTPVSWSAFPAEAVPGLAISPVTHVAIDSAGSLVKSTTSFTKLQQRDLILLGFLIHVDGVAVEFAGSNVRNGFNQYLDFVDFIEDFGPFNTSGNVYSANGVNLNLDKSSGQTYNLGSNYDNDKKRPAVTDDIAISVASLRYTYRNGIGGFSISPLATIIDPNQYDDGTGTLSSVPAGKWTIQRIFLFAQIPLTIVHYGQFIFNSKEEALSFLQNAVDLNPLTTSATFRNWLVVQQGATDLSDLNQAQFVTAGRFGLVDVISGNGGGEQNTASNVNAGGVGVFKGKSGVDLQFRGVNAASPSVTVVLDSPNDEIDIDVVAATESLAGKLEIATQAETDTGTDDLRAVTPLKLKTTPLAGRDTTAIHNNVSGEINAVASKAVPVGADVVLIEDSAAAFAKKKATITAIMSGAVSLNSFQASVGPGAISETSLTYVLIPSMTLTPGAGTYFAMFSMTMAHNKSGQTVSAALFNNGVIVTGTQRTVGGQAGNLGNAASQSIVTVGAGQAIEARWLASSNSGGGQADAPGSRVLTLIKIS